MFYRLAAFFESVICKYLPDPYCIGVILTLIVFVAAMIHGSTPIETAIYWGNGLWDLLSFAMQISLTLITGYVLAGTRQVKRILGLIVDKIKTVRQAVVIITLIASIASLINWGFGLIVGALLAKAVHQYFPKANLNLFVASAFSGWLFWHGGLSGSIPLVIATPGHFTENFIGVVPLHQSLFLINNVIIIVVLFFVVPVVNMMMINKDQHSEKLVQGPQNIEEEDHQKGIVLPKTFVEIFETTPLVSCVIGFLALLFIVGMVVHHDFRMDLNRLNFIFLVLGIVLHKTPEQFLVSFYDGLSKIGGIVLQFPLYAGMMGIIQNTGLGHTVANFFVSISNVTTLPVITFWSAGFLNIFIPSGGGQWAVQGPIMLEAAHKMGVDMTKIAMAVAWGDAWTNMIQPFWALPAVSIAGLSIKEIFGYTTVVMLVGGIIISLVFCL